jgi:hypothetical protein
MEAMMRRSTLLRSSLVPASGEFAPVGWNGPVPRIGGRMHKDVLDARLLSVTTDRRCGL